MRYLLPLILTAVVSVGCVVPALAQTGAVPGKALWGVRLGATRSSAVAAVHSRLPGAKHSVSKTFGGGIVEDEWFGKLGGVDNTFETLSRGGRVVQIRLWTAGHPGPTDLSFAQLLRRHRLQKRVYNFDDPGGGGYVGFDYDDTARGVCYTLGTQDDFLLTYKPDGIVLHRPGVPVVPIENGVRGKRVTGRDARAFANSAAADRADRKD